MNEFLQEIVFLATSVRVWLLILLVLFLFSRYRLRSQTDENMVKMRNSFSRYIKVLAWANGFFFVLNMNAWLFSGPISGRVVDAETGKPIAGARVSAGCGHDSPPPIKMPWYVVILYQRGPGVGRKTTSDVNGYYRLPWWGYGAWKIKCLANGLSVAAGGYEEVRYSHADANGNIVSAPTRLFSFSTIEMNSLKNKSQ